MTRADSYPADDVAALDRAHYWRIEEGALPALKGESSLAIAPDLELEIRVRDTEEKTYEFSLPNTFASSYFELSLPRPTQYYLGYQLKDIFTGLGISYKEGTEIRIAAEGATERSFTVGSSGFTPYLLFGTYAGSAFESPAEIFGGYRLGDKTESTIYEDFSSAKRIEITVIPPKTTAE